MAPDTLKREPPTPRSRAFAHGLPLCAAMIFLACATGLARAEAPTLDYLFPTGGRQGASISITAGGKFDPWPAQVWTDSPGLIFKAEETKGKFSVQIATNAPLGPHLIRVFNQDGASAPRCFVVGHLDEDSEKEPNEDPAKAQFLEKLPVTLNGRLEKSGDTDSFAIKLEAGQWLIAAVEAYSLDSPLDPLLHLLDTAGTKLAFNHDGTSLDPFLAFRAESAGTYIVQLAAFAFPPKAEVRFTGEEAAVYRLTLSRGPYAKYAFPSGVQRGGTNAVHLYGWNLGQTSQVTLVQVNAARLDKNTDHLLIVAPEIENALRIPVGDQAACRETEPNDTIDLAQPFGFPCTVDGRIDPRGDEDRFRFVAKKDERLRVRVKSGALGFPLDAVLQLEDRTGKQLARTDDAGGTPDPELNWTAPADGTYILAVSDLIRRGGTDYVYRLEIDHPAPDLKAVADNHAFQLEPGKTTEVKVNVSRLNGYDANVLVVADELPEGVSSTAGQVPAKGGEVKLILSARDDAKPAHQPFRVLAITTNPDSPQIRVATVELKGKNTRAGELLLNHTDKIWITVLPKPPATKTESKAEAALK